MGQGASTALAQIAADGLGLDLERIEFRSGTSDLPDAGIAGGSAHTATAGIAITRPARRSSPSSPISPPPTSARRCSRRHAGSPRAAAGCSVATMKRAARAMPTSSPRRLTEIEARGKSASDPAAQSVYAMHAHGAVFARSRSTPISARSASPASSAPSRGTGDQSPPGAEPDPRRHDLGVSFALHEQAITDRRSGRIINANLGEYHVRSMPTCRRWKP